MAQQLTQELSENCARLRSNHVRLTSLDKFFYYRFCSILCEPANSELTSLLTDSLAQNSSLEELMLDGAILFRHNNAAGHLQSVKEHLIRNNKNLKHLKLRWCESEADLLEAVASSSSLKTLEMHVQRAVDVGHLLSSTSSIESLSIQSAGLVSGLGRGLLSNRSLLRLKLTGRIQDDEMKALVEGLEQNQHSSLTSLQIKVSSTAQAVSLRNLLQSPNCRLQELDLSNSNLRQTEAQVAILEGLAGNTSLKRLVLNQSSLSRSSSLNRDAWLHAFSKNRSLQSLELASNFLRPADVSVLVEALPQSPTLQHLNLEFNFLSSGASAVLSKAMRTARWTKLSLSGMEFSSASEASMLRNALMDNRGLKDFVFGPLWLKLEDEDEKNLALRMILEGLVGNATLEKISLDGFGCNSATVRDLLLGLSDKTNLKSFTLRDSSFCPEVCDQALLHLLQSNTSLEELDLGKYGSFEESTVQSVAKGLRVNKTLKALRLFHCQVEGRDWHELFEALEENSTLESLDLKCLSAKKKDGDRIFLQLCRSLPRMQGLKRIAFHGPGGYSPGEELIPDFLHALEQNYHLEEISVIVTGKHKEQMEYILDLNKSGRSMLRSADALPKSMWPHLLARMTPKKDASALFYTLEGSVGKWSPRSVDGSPQKDIALSHAVEKHVAHFKENHPSIPSAFALAQRGHVKPSIKIAKSA
jgi:Ran GTPase-activating protein (RanGAP) involved in mRNA processing and transport